MEEPSSSVHGMKRKHSESDSSGSTISDDASLSTQAAGCMCDSQSSGTSESTPTTSVEEWTSGWTENMLNTLQISSNVTDRISSAELFSEYLLPTMTPMIFMSEGIPLTIKSTKSASEYVETMVKSCIELLNIDATPFKNIDVDDINDLDCSLAYSLMFSRLDNRVTQKKIFKRQVKSWIPGIGVGTNDLQYGYQNYFCQMFYTHGQHFTQQLISMCVSLKRKEPLLETMFETLFQEFTGMFGLLSQKQQKGSTLKIGKTLVTAKPNIVFPNFKESDEENISLLAICEVKSGYEEKDMGSPKQTRAHRQKCMKTAKAKSHLDDKLLGQHGAELLVHLSQTPTRSLLGIVVQRTNVTFSHMQCTEEELEKIQQGKRIQPNEIIYSRPYNFLKADDRRELMKAFLTLGAIQLTPYV